VRVRVDAVLISTFLFSVSLIVLVPHNLRYISIWQQRYIAETEHLWEQNYLAPIGFASLACVLIGLIVLWTGYVKKVRWTWFVMFVIVWVFAFPVYMLPALLDFRATGSLNLSAWFWNAIKSPGIARDYVKGPADFLLMVIALVLPIRSFLRNRPSVGQAADSSSQEREK